MAKVILEKDKCIGCGSCEALCSKFWKLTGDGKVDLLGSTQKTGTENYELEIKEVDCNQDAVDGCPVQCILIEK